MRCVVRHEQVFLCSHVWVSAFIKRLLLTTLDVGKFHQICEGCYKNNVYSMVGDKLAFIYLFIFLRTSILHET